MGLLFGWYNGIAFGKVVVLVRKKRRVTAGAPVWRQSSVEATLSRKPLYNGFACGHGPHGDTKYNRAKEKRAWRKDTGLV